MPTHSLSMNICWLNWQYETAIYTPDLIRANPAVKKTPLQQLKSSEIFCSETFCVLLKSNSKSHSFTPSTLETAYVTLLEAYFRQQGRPLQCSHLLPLSLWQNKNTCASSLPPREPFLRLFDDSCWLGGLSSLGNECLQFLAKQCPF